MQNPKLKILLTGATGFVGTNFILQLYKKYEIIALVRKTSNVEKIKDYCKIYHYDGGIDSIENVFKKEKIDGVVHLAAVYKPNYDKDDFQNMFSGNLSLGIHILECSRKFYLKFFINTTTFSQFANSTSYNPKTLYDAMKQAFFDIFKFYSKEKSNTKFVSLMLFNPYGIHETTLKIFSLWTKSIKNKQKIEMNCDGWQKIDVTYISDIVTAYDILINLCLKNKVKNGKIYSAENKRYSIRELANIFEKITNTKLQIEWKPNLSNVEIIQEPISYKTSKIVFKLPKWKPKISLEEGMHQIFQYIIK